MGAYLVVFNRIVQKPRGQSMTVLSTEPQPWIALWPTAQTALSFTLAG
ncbi:hypothetical protein VSVS05_04310 (plasmid) [Vibrio scophthalmi]|uniref:Uncharacterized protein n=1 Tax=Vibrio scophthalmi TaxID=45658 RepID=A0A1C7FHG0_9VIBR|nr:hypothetical protein VSVS05_04310 [Vibrio scophthalmi]